ncbi:MAG: NAD-dependent epimerase/dehydratase family protein [Athalassotoga sp.]
MGEMRILITGSTGFVGSNILRRLVNEGNDKKIHIFIRSNSNIWRIKDIIDKVSVHVVDLTKKDEVESSIFNIKPEVIFHCAIYGGYPSQTDQDQIIKTNFIGTINLLEASMKYGFKAFMNSGSSSEYGIKSQPMEENDFPDPINVYGVAKLASTYYCRMTSIKYKLPIVTLRLFSPYGYYEESGRLIPYLITSMLQNKEIKLGSPYAVRDFIFIEDVIDAFIQSAEKIGKMEFGTILNVGSGLDTKVIQVFNVLREITGYLSDPKFDGIPRDSDKIEVWRANINKINDVLGWKPKYDLKSGLVKSVEWFRDNINLYRDGN